MVPARHAEDVNPFEYVRPLPPDQVTGRDELCDQLVRIMRERGIAALVGPRRFGKTSLLGRVQWLTSQVDTNAVVSMDCYGVASEAEFAARLEAAMGGLGGTARRIVKTIFATGELGLSLEPGVGFKASIGSRSAPEPRAVIHSLMTTLVKVSEQEGGLLLVLDEFQDIGRIDGLDAVLRTYLQKAREIALIFAGSRPSLLRELFTNRARPFYSQAILIDMPRFTRAEAAAVIRDGFERTGRDAGDSDSQIARITQCHPQRLMMVANLAWDRTPPGETCTDEIVVDAGTQAHTQAANEVRAIIDGLDRTHRDALRAVAAYGSPYAGQAKRALNLQNSSAQSAAAALISEGLLEKPDDGWRVVDPFVAAGLVNLDRPPRT